jgi:hypothetical protein
MGQTFVEICEKQNYGAVHNITGAGLAGWRVNTNMHNSIQ